MKGISKRQQQIFEDRFQFCTYTLNRDLEEWQKAQMKVIQETEFKTKWSDHQWRQFAYQSFLHVIKRYVDYHKEGFEAIKSVQDIIDYPDDDVAFLDI